MAIIILRLGHRIIRDKRITTHVSLVSRAFGADKIVLSGEKDQQIINTINKVKENWGGKFEIEYKKNWKSVIQEYKKKDFSIIHLSMYGERIQDKIKKIQKNKNILVVVGGEKVPSEIYKEANFNIAVTNQPHSEVAALAIFLDKYLNGNELFLEHKGAKTVIIPSKSGKMVKSVS